MKAIQIKKSEEILKKHPLLNMPITKVKVSSGYSVPRKLTFNEWAKEHL